MNQHSSQIDRRRFMMYSAGALAPSVLAMPAGDKVDLEGDKRGPMGQETLAIGYWPGTSGVCTNVEAECLLDSATRAAAGPLEIVSAPSPLAGAMSLKSTNVKMTIYGLIGEVADLAASGIRSAALQVHFHRPGAEGSAPLKFNSWSVETGPLAKVSNGVEFQVPTDAAGLELSLDLDHTATVTNRVQRIFLGRSYKEFVGQVGGGERHQPKLRQGFYFIPLRQEEFRQSNAVSRLEVAAEPCLLLSVKEA